MKAWTIDAARFVQGKPAPELTREEVITTAEIEMFLSGDDIKFVVAPKGFGKTMLLIAKRLEYHGKTREGFILIPGHGLLVDVPKSGAATLDWGRDTIAFFSDRRSWEGVWRTAISLSIIQALRHNREGADLDPLFRPLLLVDALKGQAKYPLLHRLLTEDPHDTPLEYLNCVLSSFRKAQLRALLREQEYLDKVISNLHTPVAVFIDNVDEYFEEHLERGEGPCRPAVRGMFDMNMWYLSQQGLMFAVKTMCRNNHHLDIFVSIRKEAYARLDGTTVENLRGACLDNLEYSKAKLREMFEANIRKTSLQLLYCPGELSISPIRALCGFERVHHDIVDQEEDLFDYIYRHTLKRPRDVMRVGRSIVGLDPPERSPETVKETINKEAAEIARDYIKLSLPHTEFESEQELFDFLQHIPHNILTHESLRRICATFNAGCDRITCETCDRRHPFCDLYRLGLLGVVKYHVPTRRYRQEFPSPGELSLGGKGILPVNQSAEHGFYLVHPILGDLLGGNPATRFNGTVVVGDKAPWTPPLLPKSIQRYRLFLSYAHEDTAFAIRLAEDLRARGLAVWRDFENIAIGESFVEKVTKGIAECEYFGVVISAKAIASGWVADEIRLAAHHEIEKMRVKILPILIQGVWATAPASIKNRQYVDFRSDYAASLESLVTRLSDAPSPLGP